MNKNTEESDIYTPVIEEGAPLTTVRHDSLSTVHPNIILRTQVFTPIARNPKTKASLGRTADVSDAMRELTFAKNEGYDRVVIYGAKLDIETDFRVWGGIARAFEKAGFQAGGTLLSFKEFAALCGFPSRHLNMALRERIDRSLNRIMSQVISFGRDGDRATRKIHLLQQAGASVIYSDPHVPEIETLAGGIMRSETAVHLALLEADCSVVITDHAAFDSSRGYSPTPFNREDVFNGHQEGFIHFADRLGDVEQREPRGAGARYDANATSCSARYAFAVSRQRNACSAYPVSCTCSRCGSSIEYAMRGMAPRMPAMSIPPSPRYRRASRMTWIISSRSVGISTSTLEQRADGLYLRELKVDLTRPEWFKAADI